jgi:hypothetical protein
MIRQDGHDQAREARAASRICLGSQVLLGRLGYCALTEMTLANQRRADLVGIGPSGEIWIVEVKSGLADYRSDAKWPDYVDFCDYFSFAVDENFPRELIPEEAGLIVADGFDGAVLRPAPHRPLAPARRKAVTLRFARLAATRLQLGSAAGTAGPARLS